MKHNKKFTPYNCSKMSNKNNKYLVIHWVGAVSTAKNNADYFYNKYIGASAHYFVDGNADENQAIWQIVGENNAAWHVGAKTYKHTECRNTNSIGIEICCIKKNGQTIMDPIAIDRASKLAKSIVDMWGIKKKNILRHWDITRKNCPAEFVANETRWNNFINKIYDSNPVEPESGDMEIDKKTFEKLVKNSGSLDQVAKALDLEKNLDGKEYVSIIKDILDNSYKSSKLSEELNKKIKELEAELTNRGKECIKLEAEINQIKSENSSFLEELVELRKENGSLKKDLAKSIDTINELKANDGEEWEANGREVIVVDGDVTTKTNYKLK